MALNVLPQAFEYNQHFVAMLKSLKKMSESLKGKRKGMTWKMIDGHRVWYNKEIVNGSN